MPQDPVTTNAELISATLTTIFGDRLRSLGMDPGGTETWAHAGVGMVQAAGDWWLQRRTLCRDELRDYPLMMAWGIGRGAARRWITHPDAVELSHDDRCSATHREADPAAVRRPNLYVGHP